MNAVTPMPATTASDRLLRDQSVAKQLLFGATLE